MHRARDFFRCSSIYAEARQELVAVGSANGQSRLHVRDVVDWLTNEEEERMASWLNMGTNEESDEDAAQKS